MYNKANKLVNKAHRFHNEKKTAVSYTTTLLFVFTSQYGIDCSLRPAIQTMQLEIDRKIEQSVVRGESKELSTMTGV